MRNPGGYAIWRDPVTSTVERDTYTCFHCNTVVFVQPKQDPATMGGFCTLCMKLVCKACVGKGCTPFEKQIEAQENKAYHRAQFAKMLGVE